jgi:SlyX protein
MSDSRRLDSVEEKLAHLERAVAELSDVVLRQQREIDTALARTQRLIAQLEAVASESGARATGFEKPPHY